ncbi:MAG: hypothetical protein ACPGES_10600, partial [Coraliomargarita sp.]
DSLKLSYPMCSKSESTSNRRSKSRPKDDELKFTPNLSQLREATTLLPDPGEWAETSYTCRLSVDGTIRQIEFVKKRITRGSARVSRWMYDGKVLIRKRDI